MYTVFVLVTQSCPTLCDPTDCSPPGSSSRGILQAGILEWVAIAFSRYIYVHAYYIYHNFTHLSVGKNVPDFLALVSHAAGHLRVQASF